MRDDQGASEEVWEHAWKYFELHANQRMSMFNFFVILVGLVFAGLAASLQLSGALGLAGAGLGVLLAGMSFVFWKLDQRTAFFLKHAEQALIAWESRIEPTYRLFVNERSRTAEQDSGRLWSRQWTYGRSFRVVFVVTGLLGVAGAMLAIGRELTAGDVRSARVPSRRIASDANTTSTTSGATSTSDTVQHEAPQAAAQVSDSPPDGTGKEETP
jgi:hypothetical protein